MHVTLGDGALEVRPGIDPNMFDVVRAGERVGSFAVVVEGSIVRWTCTAEKISRKELALVAMRHLNSFSSASISDL